MKVFLSNTLDIAVLYEVTVTANLDKLQKCKTEQLEVVLIAGMMSLHCHLLED